LTIAGADREALVVMRRGRWKTVCARGAALARQGGRSASPLGTRMTARACSVFSVALTLVAISAFAAIPLHLESIQARLFFNHTGTFSEPLSAKDALRNVIIGESGLPSPSRSTLVDVTLRGEPREYRPGRIVVLTVSDSSRDKAIATLTQQIGAHNADG